MNKKIILSTVALLALSLALPAGAFNTRGKWSSSRVTMRASQQSFPAGNAFRTSLGTVIARFNQNPSNQSFTVLWDDSATALGNRESEVWFSTSSQYNPAITYWWITSTGIIVEADVIFYSGVNWTASMNKTSLITYGGAARPFENTAMHEFGHAAGLRHEEGEYNIMGQDWTHIHLNGLTCRSYVGEDASAGLAALYGAFSAGVREDVAATHWKYKSFTGEYSTHQLCSVLNAAGAAATYTVFEGQRRFAVTRGQSFQFEFTFENLGETTRTVNLGYYVSTDSTIATTDRRVATRRVTLAREDVDTLRQSLVIPTDLVAGRTYWVGVIVDWDNLLAEVDAVNNAAQHTVLVN
jgi:hypothetical protein